MKTRFKIFVGAALVAVGLFIFCGGEGTPDYCGDGHPYNTVTQFCHDGEAIEKCGNTNDGRYDPATQFCDDDQVYERCGGRIYDPVMNFCDNGEVIERCAGEEFDPTEYICNNNILQLRQTFSLTANANPVVGGNVSPMGTTRHTAGTSITVTATEAEGYAFTGWMGAPESVNSSNKTITFELNSDVTLIANFESITITHTLTINANPIVGGNVSPTGTITREAGTSITVAATESEGYEFIGWTGAPSSVNESDNSITFNIDDDMTLTANFRQINTGDTPITYSLATGSAPSDGGTITRSPDRVSFDAETEITLTATPSEGFVFTGWTGALESADSELSFIILSDMNITANFKRVYTLTTNISPENSGNVVRSPNQTSYDAGTEITLTAIQEHGYRFDGWTGAPVSVNAASANIALNMPANDLTLTANFQRIHTLAVNRNLTTGGNVTVNGGANNPGPSTHDEGAQVTVSATANSGYRFVNWSGASESDESTITIEMSDDLILTANFIQTQTISVSSNLIAGGSVAVNGTTITNSTIHDVGATVTITATANTHYEFVNWTTTSDGVVFVDENSATTTFTMPANAVTVTANFKLLPSDFFTETVNGISFKMIAVEGGTFTMGCTAEQGNDCLSDESPTSQVTLSDFYIGEFEVTQGLWEAVMNSPMPTTCGRHGIGDNFPVYCISWNEIVNDFIPALNALTGRTYRLPTEAEWEYAARGGHRATTTKYAGSNNIDEVAWYWDARQLMSSRHVGTKLPNELEIYDMNGNVWEWVHDWYGPYTETAKTNPTGPATATSANLTRVLRGGSWYFGPELARVSGIRGGQHIDLRENDYGFRLAVSAE